MRALAPTLIALLSLPGCFSPSFGGEGQFFCRDKTAQCPGGFSCITVDEISPEFRGKKLCVRDDDVPAGAGDEG